MTQPAGQSEISPTDGGLRRLVQVRRYDDIHGDYFQDQDGFVTRTKDLFPAAGLLDRRASFVLAPPWIGKSFVAQSLDRNLRLLSATTAHSFGQYIHLTAFEAYAASGDDPMPPWWIRWSTSSATACWIIDALDEGDQQLMRDGPHVDSLRRPHSLEMKRK